ncbi:DNA ligase (NAD+) [Marchantia polymorpha subsp. ruderalis]|uniref:DNA ligase (NAD(+)) n=2 Tax=Marchantia polymorpha TaxID=3197 RepID=A0AAF6AVH1_MARPO|nr:hypothetical protein MARPO_0107s0037 [Marchantia polymorpha]BBN00442.1 hypothetical protein Mp_1g29220 [Marchantia polymorpha subsp. ruderalis]|eukprot:PTQ31770.1 hypothetical protein MARPO_0107s0037 [Marchantia polymorpha]
MHRAVGRYQGWKISNYLVGLSRNPGIHLSDGPGSFMQGISCAKSPHSRVNTKYFYPMESVVFKQSIPVSRNKAVGATAERGVGSSKAPLQVGRNGTRNRVGAKSVGGRCLSSKRLMESAFQVLRDLRKDNFSLGLFRLGRSAASEKNLLSSNAREHSGEAEFEWSAALWEAEVSSTEDEICSKSSSGIGQINPAEIPLNVFTDSASRVAPGAIEDARDPPPSNALEAQGSDRNLAEIVNSKEKPSELSQFSTTCIIDPDNHIQEEAVVEESTNMSESYLKGSPSSDVGDFQQSIEEVVTSSSRDFTEDDGLVRSSDRREGSEIHSESLALESVGEIDEVEQVERLKKLREAVAHHAYQYNTLDDPQISDSAFDALVREMKEAEASFSNGNDSEHPVIGAPPSPAMPKVQHSVPMLSLASVQKEEELVSWHQRLQQKLGPDEISLQWVVEPKVDGLALSLLYEDGKLVRASTRGNGFEGEDVTLNAQNVSNIPQVLPGSHSSFSTIEVRGEIYMPLKQFEEINSSKVQAGEKPFANPRNAAAGSMRLLSPQKVDHRPLSFVAYNIAKISFTEPGTDVPKSSLSTPSSQWEALKLLNTLGFFVNEDNQIFNTFESALEYAKSWRNSRAGLGYEADGVVFKLNDGATQVLLGDIGGNPRWAVAWKFAATEVVTVLEGIELTVGRSGVIVPNARLKPVELGGVSIRRATLHNFKNVKNLGLCEGDHVIVQRAGDVIPQVVQALVELRPVGAQTWSSPTQCPSCGSELKEEPSKAMVFCQNANCLSRRSRQVEHFAKSLINGLGPKILTQLQEEGLVADPADLYTLSEEALSNVPRFGKKSAKKLLGAIEESKLKQDWEFIAALGIPRVGVGISRRLAEHFGGLQGLLSASDEDILSVPGIGEQTLKAVFDWCRCESNIGLVSKLLAAGCARAPSYLQSQGVLKSLNIANNAKQDSIGMGTYDQHDEDVETVAGNENSEESRAAAELNVSQQKLLGKIVVITGNFGSKDREYMQALVRLYGGKVRSSVTSKTSFVLAGENPGGNKISACKELGIEILDWEKFQSLLGTS